MSTFLDNTLSKVFMEPHYEHFPREHSVKSVHIAPPCNLIS
jgi:hypothetical protein